jgi:hypothetical protein
MKKYVFAGVILLLSLKCYSGEWIAVGEQPDLSNTDQLESQLWKYLEGSSSAEFKPKETYRFQYKFINQSVILINALCLPSPGGEADLGAYPGPTNKDLKDGIYQVHDGGSCFFSIKFDVERARFHSLHINDRA